MEASKNLEGLIKDCKTTISEMAILSRDEKVFILDSIKDINHHIAILNDEHGDLCVKVAAMESNQQHLLWINKLVLGTLITGIVGAILLLITG